MRFFFHLWNTIEGFLYAVVNGGYSFKYHVETGCPYFKYSDLHVGMSVVER